MNLQELAVELADLRRRFENVLCLGVIAEADYAAARVRVSIGALKTTWLPWLTHRAGGDSTWHAPEVGEQVLVLSPSGDLAQGVVLPAIFYASHPANASAATVHRTTYADGAVIEYDRAAHELKLTIPGKVTLNATGHVTATIGGNLASTVAGNASVQVTGTASVSGTAGITLASPASIALTAPAIALNGAVAVSAGAAGGGGMQVAGAITAGGDITNNGGSLGSLGTLQAAYNAHTHLCSGPGAASSVTNTPVP